MRGKPQKIKQRRAEKAEKQAYQRYEKPRSSQPTGRGRGRGASEAQKALAQLKASRVYGRTEQAQLRNIRNENILDRARRQQSRRNDEDSLIEKAGEVLSTEIPGSEKALKLAGVALTKNPSTYDALPDIPRATVGEAALGAIPVGRVAGAGVRAAAAKAGEKAATKIGNTGAVRSATRAAYKAKGKAARRPRPVKAAKAKASKTKAAESAKAKARAAAKRAEKAAQSRPGQLTVKAGKKGKKAYNSKPGAVVRKPVKAVRKHPVAAAGAGIEAPAAIAIASGKEEDALKKLTAPIEGTAKAILNSPKQTAATTGHAVVGGFAALAGLAGNTAKTGAYAAREGLDEANLPGGKDYSAEEITAPVRAAGEEIGKFAEDYYKTYSSGDSDLIEKKTREEYGLGMLLPVLGAGRARAVRKGEIVANPRKGMGILPPVRAHREAKDAARRVSKGNRSASIQGMHFADELDKRTGHQGARSVTKKNPVSGRRRDQMIAPLAKGGYTRPEHVEVGRKARNKGKRSEMVPEGVMTHFDAAEDARTDPGLFHDKQIQDALNYLRHESDQDDISFSDVKKYETQFIDAEYETGGRILHPHKVVLPAGTKVPTEGGVFTLSKPTGWFHDTQPSGGKPLTKKMRAVNDLIAERQVALVRAWAKQTGRVDPIYVGSVTHDAMRPEIGESGPQGKATRPSHQRGRESKTKLNRAGEEDLSYETFRVRSGFEPRAMIEQNRATRDALQSAGIRVPTPRNKKEGEYFISKRERRLLAAKKSWKDPQTGKTVKYDDLTFIDAQTGKAAGMDREASGEGGLILDPLADSIARKDAQARGGFQLAKGPGFFVVPKKWGEEFLLQHGRLQERWLQKAGQGLLPTQRLAAKAILGYSPSWLLAQPIAEGMQALAAVGPLQMYKGHKRYKQMTPKQQREFDAGIGGTIGTGSVFEALTNARQIERSRDGRNAVVRASQAARDSIRTTPGGRVAYDILSTRMANKIDRKKGLAIRRAVAAGHLEREYNGFTGALKGFLREQDRLDRQMRNLTPVERLQWVTKNPQQMRKLERYVDDVMGNWTALTTNERAFSSVLIFYPFVRMSMEWTALTYPARHPLKTAAIQFLGMNNAQQVERYFGGAPNFFSGWGTAFLYDSEGNATNPVPFSRATPGLNPIIEAVGGDATPRDFFRITNPILNAAAAAGGGYDPLSGRNLIDKYEKPGWEEALRSVGSSVANMPSILRVLDQNGPNLIEQLAGKEQTAARKYFDEMQKKDLLRGLVPFIPASNVSDARAMQEVGRLLDRAYDSNEDIEEAIQNMQATIKAGRGGKAQAAIVKTLDALVASNRLAKLYEQKKISGQTYTEAIKKFARNNDVSFEQAQDLVYAQMPSIQIPKTWNQILQSAEDAGYPIERIKKLRRARARKIMGNS